MRWAGFAAGAALTTVCSAWGAALGVVAVKLFGRRTGMGWDHLADALGGLMLGGLVGLVVGAFATQRVDARRRARAALALFAVGAVGLIALRLTREPREPSEPVVREAPFAPAFRLSIRVGHSAEVLGAVSPGAEPIPFTEVGLWTATGQLERVGWGPDFPTCRVEVTRSDLEALTDAVRSAFEEAAAGSCKTARDDDLGIAFRITWEGSVHSGRADAGCLEERPALARLADELGVLAARACPK